MGRVKDAAFAWPPATSGQPIDLCSDPCFPETSTMYTPEQVHFQQMLNTSPCYPNQPNMLASVGYNGCPQPVNSASLIQTQQQNAAMRMMGQPMSQAGYYPLVPLGGGGFIFNYPPVYSQQPLPPFTTQTIPTMATTPPSNGSPMFPSSPILSPTGSSCPTSPQDSFSTFSPTSVDLTTTSRKEKLEKYRQKRVKRNFNRQADPARRERAQSRPRDEHGHFASSKKVDPDKARMLMELGDVKNMLQAIAKESKELKDKLTAVEHELHEHQKLNTQLLHENRVLWGSVPTDEVFNTVRPGAPFADAFKEKIDFSSIELNLTQSHLLDGIRENEEFEKRWMVNTDFTSGSFS